MSGLLDNQPFAAVRLSDSPSIDAFDRLRVSNPATVFDSSFQYDDSPTFWQTSRTGGGTATHLPERAAVRMITTASSGDEVIRQTYQYFRYQPGKSQLVFLTFMFGPRQINCTKEVGYNDAENGILLQDDGASLGFIRRSKVTGNISDERVVQSAWNLDPMDGSGPSKVTLDISKVHILVMDLEWLGVGRVRIGFVIDGIIVYCHQFLQANIGTSVYMTTANLPLRYRIRNTGASTASFLSQICSAVISEGGFEIAKALRFEGGTGATTRAPASRSAIVGIRPKRLFGSSGTLVNRTDIRMDSFAALVQSNNAYFEIIYNPTSVDGATWISANGSSAVEVDTTGSTITGGIAVDSTYSPAAGGGNAIRSALDYHLQQFYPLCLDLNGSNPQSIYVACTGIGGTPTVNVEMTWLELR